MSLHLDRDWLHQKYVVEQLSTYEIAKMVSRDAKRVYEKLIDFGIPTRPRSENNQRPKDRKRRHDAMVAANPFTGKKHSAKTKAILSEKASVPKPYLRGTKNGMSGRTGERSPRWKGGVSPERQRLYASGQWKEIARTVYKRDNYRCQRCGSTHTTTNKLHAHHIYTWGDFPELRLSLSNLITLCNHCHIWVHGPKNVSCHFLGSTPSRASSSTISDLSESDSPLFN